MNILHKALMKFGVGNWSQIIESDCLPGKTNAQLNNQTQRMLGQQSTAGRGRGWLGGAPRRSLTARQLHMKTLPVVLPTTEFAGLHIDVFEIGKRNSTRDGTDIRRKNGIIVNTGGRRSALRAVGQVPIRLDA